MKEKLDKGQIGLAVGLFFAVVHAAWAAAIALTPTLVEKAINWILSMHFLKVSFSFLPFSFGNAIILVVLTCFCRFSKCPPKKLKIFRYLFKTKSATVFL